MIVVLAVIAIMMSLVYPVYQSMSQSGKGTKDLNNLRQIGMLMQSYLNDNDQILPAVTAWPGSSPTPVLYPKYTGSRRVFESPFDKRPTLETDATPVSYGINQNMYDKVNGSMIKVVSPSSTILMAPSYSGNPGVSTSWTGIATAAPTLMPGGNAGMTIGPQRGTQINALFCDLHAETMTFGPNASPATGSFKDITSDPLGLKHWDPTK
jgi:type II secretory pathway pseudopilin PulG